MNYNDTLDNLFAILRSMEVTPYTATLKMLFSFVLGAIIGFERQFRRHDAGMRTFTLICMGSTAAMLLSVWIPQSYPNFLNGDPGRIAAQVLTGIGFLGAGAIIQSHGSVHGLTTAACIWVVAVIGLTVGAGMYITALITTLLTLFVLVSLERLERRMWLDGVNKILSITCDTATPDLRMIRSIIENRNIFIVSLSYEQNYEKDIAIITFKVNVKAKSSYTELFNQIRSLGYISQIKLLA
ncbi:MAG: MgtC/SapB family protein [Parabacteroides sp.]|jgi:putative Mg2+ transporter-C (MgtC) family protein|nr:MgtC/SapB family protein [Parabacteroides sp.]MDD2415285.1 MgtC/SapB family protein [Parabacteroides sp.]MDD3357596.1 MgtC/SapB family protein [Parabacteroides sp.]MDD4403266.1 MgtC/SapB family protein [Parabacteroides sp.]